MKLNKVLTLSGMAIASTFAMLGISTSINASPNRPLTSPSGVIVAQVAALMSGEFTAAESPTTGTANIVESNGQTYLEIDSAFRTGDTAPDLQVLLDTVEQPPAAYEDADYTRYLNLGGLQSITGEQRYPIPDFVDTSQFNSVVVWCREFNATYGYAPLSNDTSASIR